MSDLWTRQAKQFILRNVFLFPLFWIPVFVEDGLPTRLSGLVGPSRGPKKAPGSQWAGGFVVMYLIADVLQQTFSLIIAEKAHVLSFAHH